MLSCRVVPSGILATVIVNVNLYSALSHSVSNALNAPNTAETLHRVEMQNASRMNAWGVEAYILSGQPSMLYSSVKLLSV